MRPLLERPAWRPHRACVALDARRAPLSSGRPVVTERLVADLAGLLWGDAESPRFAICHGLLPRVLGGGSVSLDRALERIVDYRRELCTRVFARLLREFGSEFGLDAADLVPLEYSIDGIHVNPGFYDTGLAFWATQRLHFDILEPFGSNLYLPRRFVSGGLPVFADAAGYCVENGYELRDLLVKIPGTRNLTLAPEHHVPLLADHAMAFDGPWDADAPFSLVNNLVLEAGLMHGATTPRALKGEASRRELVHFALDDPRAESIRRWYARFGLSADRAPGATDGRKPLLPADADAHEPLERELPPRLDVSTAC